MDPIQMGKLIADLRKQRGFTQRQLADQLHLSDKTISKWESGAGSPDLSNLTVLAEALGISVDELLKGRLNRPEAVINEDLSEDPIKREAAAQERTKERAVMLLAACAGAVLGILAYNFGWLG